MQVLIYRDDEGRICVVTPAPEYADQIIAVGEKDIPLGKPFKLMDASQLPVDSPREEWVFDDATFTDGIGTNVVDHDPAPGQFEIILEE